MGMNYDPMQASRDAMKEMKDDQRAITQLGAINRQSNELKGVHMSTSQMAQAQFKSNELQRETNKILKNTCDKLEERNKILSQELKTSKIVNIVSVCVAVATTLASIVTIVLSVIN